MANPPGTLGAVTVFVIRVGARLERRQNLAVTLPQRLIAWPLPSLTYPGPEQRAVAGVAFYELTSAGAAHATLPITPAAPPRTSAWATATPHPCAARSGRIRELIKADELGTGHVGQCGEHQER